MSLASATATATAPAPELQPIPLTQQVADNLRTRILKGDLRPGERLVEQHLARSLGVGQNAVREALIDLAHRGFVRRVTNKATYVTSLTYEDARQLAEVRTVLEGLAITLVARRLGQNEPISFDALEAIAARMKIAAQAADRVAFYDADLSWHQELWRLAGNQFLTQSLDQIVVPLFAFFIVIYVRPDNAVHSFLEAVAAHQKVIDGLKSADQSRASVALCDLVDLSLKHQQGLIAEQS